LDEIEEVLSRRELEVLALAASGCKNDEIAKLLYISKATVKTHLQHIYNKLGVTNRTAAVTKALTQGWLIREDEVISD
jgi:ATP/maltotriose-dependent transcriptional regulator MalT